MESPVSSNSLALRGPNSHGWARYSTPGMPSRVATISANVVLRGDDEVARPHQHQSGRDDVAVHLRDRDLAQVAPATRTRSNSATPAACGVRRETRRCHRRSGTSSAAPGRGVPRRSRSVFPMSCPAEKLGPFPARMITATRSSASARRSASSNSTSSPRFWALRASGRLRLMRAIVPSWERFGGDEPGLGHGCIVQSVNQLTKRFDKCEDGNDGEARRHGSARHRWCGRAWRSRGPRTARRGAAVVIADLADERGERLAAELGDRVAYQRASVPPTTRLAPPAAAAALGELRTVVVAHGGWGVAERLVGRDGTPATLEGFSKTLDLYLSGTFNVARLAAAHGGLGAAGVGERGRSSPPRRLPATRVKSARPPTPPPRPA